MKINIILFNILLLLLFHINEKIIAYSSLFFRDEEINCRDKEQRLASSYIELRAILFHNDHQWSIWIGNQVIHPENTHSLEGFQIEKVTATSVTLSQIQQENEVKKTITLYPYSMKTNNFSNESKRSDSRFLSLKSQ
jgi:hypothetical protein